MPNLSLDVGDAAELAEILQSFCHWLAANTAASARRYSASSVAPPAASPSFAPTSTASHAYSAVATANRCSNHASDKVVPGRQGAQRPVGPCADTREGKPGPT